MPQACCQGKFNVLAIGDTFELYKSECGLGKISVLLYMTLCHFGRTWRDISVLPNKIGGSSCRVADRWTDKLLEGDFGQIEDDRRGRKYSNELDDPFPELCRN